MGAYSIDGQPRPVTPVELQAVIQAERRDESFLVYRDGEGRLQTVALSGEFTVGRNAEAALSIHWDDQVSGLHAELKQLGGGADPRRRWPVTQRVLRQRRARSRPAKAP